MYLNKYFFKSLIFFLLAGNVLFAQNEITLSKGDSLELEIGGYQGGDIYWQRSTNANATGWINVNAIRNSVKLKQKVSTAAYYRSKITDGTCKPYYSDTVKVSVLGDISRVKAGHGYAEPYSGSPGIKMVEKGSLSAWSDVNRKAVWYLYQKAGKYELSFLMNSKTNKSFKFEMNTSPCYDGLNYQPEKFAFTCQASGNSANDTIKVFSVTIPATGYYRYELTAKSSMANLTIDELWFTAINEPGISASAYKTNATDYLSSPSVHLSFSTTASTTKQYDWIYEEILVPEGFDPLSTYWMSLGFFRGYMGIQTNGEKERRVLFSAWDAVDKDKYPNAPKEMLVSLVDKAKYTAANSFGNEGTGGQSYVGTGNPDTWKTGTPVKFLMNCRRDGSITYQGDVIKHSIISAWYDAGEGWRYVASWRVPIMPGGKDMFDGFYSFLENYGFQNGQIIRKGYYYNAFGKELGKDKWVHFNKVGFSNTDGKEGQRIDFEQGVSTEYPDKFYMVSAGYGKTKKTANTVPLITDFPYLESLDLTPFETRVTEAIAREEYLNNIPFLDKTGWEVTGFSSEETSGEPNGNGLASLIIDGDDDTYWHSKWKSGSSFFPHWFVVDMKGTQTLKGFKFVGSGGVSRQMKNIKIEVSNSSSSGWTEVWSGVAPMAPDLLELETPVSGFRYFKLTIEDGYEDGVHTRLNEIYVF
ncbi:DUF3472 domain-containing protein [Paludibacter sp. 221]|uniref:DUF3472 domain-containing protein n=1 Tax=Paludibacter sp. 221 TaxID=2302939 RepID=UPI0013D1506D|nr:DUF3472 domain-containing protein [Paludibacter sp. 221]NDV46889.1 DUF3472 domain-containing protein [Paludibacter sp. 221]